MIDLNPIHAPVRLSVAEGFRCVSTGIGAWGEAIRLSVPAQMVEGVFGTVQQSGWASFPKTHTDQTYAAIVSVTTATNTIVRQLPMIATAYPIVQTLPGDNLLVVAQRCQRSSDGTHEQNAKVYRADGSLGAEFCLGDGIEHVQADKAGRLWVSYFDEGIFGNFGWGTGEGATPLGVAGLVCYDTRGRKLWEFQPPPGFEDMADCYVLNVAEEAVWACYYTDFPIVCVDPQGHTKAWTTELSGPRELAVSGDSVLAYGGHMHRQDCNLLRLRDGRAEHVAQVTLHLPHPLDPSASQVIGRDNLLHLFSPEEWYVFSVPS